MTFVRSVFERITRPDPRLNTVEVRQQARSLAVISLALLVTMVVVAPSWISGSPDFVFAPFIAVTQIIGFILAYGFSRTRWYRMGAGLLVISFMWLVIANLIFAPGILIERMLALNFLIFPIILSRYFLKTPFRIALTVLAILVIAMFFFVPGVPFVFTYSYLVFFGTLVAFGTIDNVISERYRAQAARSEARYRALFQQSHDAVFILDLDGNHVDANERAAQMLGYNHQELLSLSFRNLSTEVEASLETLKRLLRGEQLQVYERVFRRKDGVLIPVEINVELVRDLAGQPLHIQSVVRDISERKRSEDALRASETRQRALLNAIPDLMFMFDKTGVYLDYHAAKREDLAAPPEVFLGRSIPEVLPSEIATPIMQRFERLISTKQEQTFEYTLPMGDQLIDYEFRLVMCGDDILSLVRNVSERRQAQQRSIELQLEKERTRLIAQFVQYASHELRTPLSVISTGLTLMARANDRQRRDELALRGEQQVARIAHLLDVMLTLSRLDSGIAFRQDPVQLNQLIADLKDDFEKSHPQKAVSLHVLLQPNLPAVTGDEPWLAEALEHLFENATRFTPDDGTITMTSCQRGDDLVIAVSDTGTGIADDELPRIFERFWRHDEARTTPGFGLGLPIVREIVKRHGGTVEVESQLGKGSTFRIVLPREGTAKAALKTDTIEVARQE